MHLDQDQVDEHFIEELCSLDKDAVYRAGCAIDIGLYEYLIRYVIMFFDFDFGKSGYMEDILRRYMNNRRDYTPRTGMRKVTLEEAGRLFGVGKEEIQNMSRSELAKRYRQLALKLHPDQGGHQDTFIRLTTAYHDIMKTKP
jgi:hypothetical protein